jgi:hypothetical protein
MGTHAVDEPALRRRIGIDVRLHTAGAVAIDVPDHTFRERRPLLGERQLLLRVYRTERAASPRGAHRVIGQQFTAAGTPSGSRFEVYTTPTSQAVGFGLRDGRAGMLWLEGNLPLDSLRQAAPPVPPSAEILQLAMVSAAGLPGAPRQLASAVGAPQVAVLDDDRIVVLWLRPIGSSGTLEGVLLAGDGTVSDPDFVRQDSDLHGPAVTTDGTSVWIAWFDGGADTVRLHLLRHDTIDMTRSQVDIPVPAGYRVASRPDIAIRPDDGALAVVWSGGADDDHDVHLQLFHRDGTAVGSPIVVPTTTSGHQAFPSVAATADGSFAVVWTDASGAAPVAEVTTVRMRHLYPDR